MRIINGFFLVNLLSLKHLMKRDFMFSIIIFLLEVVAYIGFLLGLTLILTNGQISLDNQSLRVFYYVDQNLDTICLFLRNFSTIIWYEEFNTIRGSYCYTRQFIYNLSLVWFIWCTKMEAGLLEAIMRFDGNYRGREMIVSLKTTPRV